MSELLGKFGLYDLVAVLFSGMCIMLFSRVVDTMIFQSQILEYLKIEKTANFLIVSYFVGMVFQEIGSNIYKICFQKNDRYLARMLDEKINDSRWGLTLEEKKGIKAVLKRKLNGNQQNVVMLYNYCKFYSFDEKKDARLDIDQSAGGLSRSLAIYLASLAPAILLKAACEGKCTYLLCAIAIEVIAVILHFRCMRFVKMRYAYIFRTFYYRYLRKGEGK